MWERKKFGIHVSAAGTIFNNHEIIKIGVTRVDFHESYGRHFGFICFSAS